MKARTLKLLPTWLVILSIQYLVSACSLPAPSPDIAPQETLFAGVPANPFGQNIFLSQRIVGTFNGDKKTLQFDIEVRKNELVMVATTPTGIPVFTIFYDGQIGSIQKHVPMPGAIDPNWILNDFLLAYWPREILLANPAASQQVIVDSATRRALLAPDGKVQVEIRYQTPQYFGARLELQNLKYGYELSVTTYHLENNEAAQ